MQNASEEERDPSNPQGGVGGIGMKSIIDERQITTLMAKSIKISNHHGTQIPIIHIYGKCRIMEKMKLK